MANFGKCPKHDVEYEEDDARCSTCGGDGMVEDDDGGWEEMVICYRCKGSGEVSYPVCQQCDDEYDDSDY